MGDNSDRIYKVIYEDKAGHTHAAFVKTSMWSGVYFSDDEIIKYAEGQDHPSAVKKDDRDLHMENERLKKEIEDLKKKIR